VILGRIARFLNDSADVPAGVTASQTTTATPAWAAGVATRILDDHAAQTTEAPGLVRFLSKWLKIQTAPSGTPAHTWVGKLLDPNATLTTLFTAKTSDPHRNGIFTDSQWLSVYPGITGRGQWLAETLFCAPSVGSIPVGLPPLSSGSGTRRQRLVGELTPNCMGCHNQTDPAGFSLEHFDERGAYRDMDNGKPVDSTGTLLPPLPGLTFTSIDDLAPQMATSCVVALCFTNSMMGDAFAAASDMSADLGFTKQEAVQVATAFASSNFSIRALMKAIVTTPSFLRGPASP